MGKRLCEFEKLILLGIKRKREGKRLLKRENFLQVKTRVFMGKNAVF